MTSAQPSNIETRAHLYALQVEVARRELQNTALKHSQPNYLSRLVDEQPAHRRLLGEREKERIRGKARIHLGHVLCY
jgi:hypothetical protein